ncbi:GNAT family N-acetyltransferase [Dietzia sp. B32]|uniref:GNAT family N-acetyltransferase n=1 Tax=Dietzia sp. B32 TaxID=2915130 RepID=UPI0021ADACA1|nr:GNAT family N-acetyltransferase [Dietzia sp. B32]UVE94622.1 GNAT family N-acetyltransferase [Dietzia sp. B32]
MSNAIETAANRRREVFAAVSSADGPEDAVRAIASLLSVSPDEARDVLKTPLETFAGSPSGGSGDGAARGFTLRPFTESEEHTSLFHARSSDETSATGGTWDLEKTEQELRDGLARVEAESAMWFVAVDTSRDAPVGLVFGEQVDNGDVDVAIWIRPEERKKGFGLASLKESRRELAAFFPGKHVIVRAPLGGGR